MIASTTRFLFALFFAFFSVQLVASVPIIARDVYDPPVTYPTAATTWVVGQTYTVTWNTSNPPQEITNPVGKILLQKADDSITPIELAGNFSILLGSMEITVPYVPPASDYFVDVFGDSGNWSPEFTIIA